MASPQRAQRSSAFDLSAWALDRTCAGVRGSSTFHIVTDKSKWAITAAGGIPPLVQLLETGSAKAKEDSAVILGNLCSHSEDIRACVETAEAVPALKNAGTTGQEIASRALIQLVRSSDASTISQLTALLTGDLPKSKVHVVNLVGSCSKFDGETTNTCWFMQDQREMSTLNLDAKARKRRRRSYEEDLTIQNHKFRVPWTEQHLKTMFDSAMEKPGELMAQAEVKAQVETQVEADVQATERPQKGNKGKKPTSTEAKLTNTKNQKHKKEWRHRGHLVEEIGMQIFKVKDDNGGETIYNVQSLALLFPEFAVAAKQFAESLDRDPDSFIACVVYSIVEIEMKGKRHNIYRRIAYKAEYNDCTKLPEYLMEAVQNTWSFPGEEFKGHLYTHEREDPFKMSG